MGYAIPHIKQAQAVINAAFGDFRTGAIWRNAVEAGGQVGAVVLVTTTTGWRRPTTYFAQTKRLVPEQWLNSARIVQVLQVASTVDIRMGDRWIEGGLTYIVDAPPITLAAITLCALAEIKEQT